MYVNCGVSLGKKVIGKASFERSGDTLGVAIKLGGADPGRNYSLFLVDGATCGFIASLGNFKVDASGHGSKVGYADVTGLDEFFVSAVNNDTVTANDSLVASL